MAKNVIDNLSEETRRGMLEKARSGIYPSFAPVGYRNVDGPNGKRVIVPDPATAGVITELFARFRTGRYSLESLVEELRGEGMTLRGQKLHRSTAHQILRKRLYMGDFDWDGTTYQGTHEPLVTRESWQRGQELLNTRAEKKTRKERHDFAFTGVGRSHERRVLGRTLGGLATLGGWADGQDSGESEGRAGADRARHRYIALDEPGMPDVSAATGHRAAPVAAGADPKGRLEGRGVTHETVRTV